MNHSSGVLVLDFGSQYNQLIARRVRELGVYCKIVPFNVGVNFIKEYNPEGIILSGGPASVYVKGTPDLDKQVLNLGIPVLCICYGMQLVCKLHGGKIVKSKGEYGKTRLKIKNNNLLFDGLDDEFICWMSHSDEVVEVPDSWKILAKSRVIASYVDSNEKIYGVQFHPEVTHTENGSKIIENFVLKICKAKRDWDMGHFATDCIKKLKDKIKDDKVVLGLSGGVDSSVAAVLLHRAIGKNLTCIFVNMGLLRLNEEDHVRELVKNLGLNVRFVRPEDRFLKALKSCADPERKRKIIGRTFIKVFQDEARKIKGAKYLGQGTLYPDVIESVTTFGGPSATIKSHHNVGGLPEKMHLKLVEPLRELFKDEVRRLGKELGVPKDLLNRHPFPGPGLAVRILGSITKERIKILQAADSILIDEIKGCSGLYERCWQAFCVLLPVKSVGVMGDQRTYEYVVAIRAVTSQDGMTADWVKMPYNVLSIVSSRIINEVPGINRVVYDISSKPPATIEWE